MKAVALLLVGLLLLGCVQPAPSPAPTPVATLTSLATSAPAVAPSPTPIPELQDTGVERSLQELEQLR